MKIEISLKDFMVYLLIAALIVFVLILWQKVDVLSVKNQVMVNDQSIQDIINYINQQQANQQPQIRLPKSQEKKDGK